MRSRSDSASSAARSASHSEASWLSRSSKRRSQCTRQSVGGARVGCTSYPHSSADRPRAGARACSTVAVRPPTGEFAMMLHEYFAPQPTPTRQLPDPAPLLRRLTHGVLEVLAGVREIDQLARWFSEDAYRSLVVRSNLAARARSARGVPPARPTFVIRSLRVTEPVDGVIEAVVVVAGPGRTRAVAVRLEGLDRRWRATSLAIL
nr:MULTISPECIES: Rv3235 family protein [Microbacterium]